MHTLLTYGGNNISSKGEYNTYRVLYSRTTPAVPRHNRHQAITADQLGDKKIVAEVMARPFLLRIVFVAGYAMLWTESAMAWLGYPLPLLPDVRDPVHRRGERGKGEGGDEKKGHHEGTRRTLT